MKSLLKQFFIILGLSMTTLSFSQDTLTQIDINGHLQVSGNKILGDHGNPVQLRGMSLFWSQWGEGSKYYNAGVVNTLANDWKANVVRIALGIDEGTTGYIHNPATERAKVIRVIDAAIANGIYVIIDWHSHQAHLQEEEAKAFFGEMAQLYGDYPNVIYEVYNEPLNVSWPNIIKPYCEAVIDTIRAHDPDNLVICGTRTWSQRIDEVINNEINDNNVAYTLHYYAATHKESLRANAQKTLDAGIPLFVTEMGTTEASGDGIIDYEESNIWWDFLDENHIGWCNWSVSDKDEAASAVLPNTPSNGDWEVDDYTASGSFVRNELRSSYEIPSYDNQLSITANYGNGLFKTDSIYLFDLNLFNNGVLINDSLVTYKLELSNGGTISDSATFTSNGEAGEYKLFVTALYDTLVSTATFDFIVTDIEQGELQNSSDKSYLALTLNDSYLLNTPSSLLTSVITQTVPHVNDSLIINVQDHVWKAVNEPSGIFAQQDSAVKSFFSIYVINPVSRLAQIETIANGTTRFYINGKLVRDELFELIKGENLFVIEYTGKTDTSSFDFNILNNENESMQFLTYSLNTNNTFDCAKTWRGTAFIDSECGCIGGESGTQQCPGPFNGTPTILPNRIESEEYDYGDEGIAYSDNDNGNNGNATLRDDDVDISADNNGGHNIGWIDDNEFLLYTIEVLEDSTFIMDYRIASGRLAAWNVNSSFNIKIDGKNIFENDQIVPITSGWNSYETVTTVTFPLSAGIHEMTFNVIEGAFNIDYLDIRYSDALAIEDYTLTNIALFPNPYNDVINLSVDEPTSYSIYNTLGEYINSGDCDDNCVVGKELNSGIYLIQLTQGNGKTGMHRIIKQ